MYKIKVNKTGIGWKLTLYKKWWIIWFPETTCHIAMDYEYLVDKQINKWIDFFNIPEDLVEIKEK